MKYGSIFSYDDSVSVFPCFRVSVFPCFRVSVLQYCAAQVTKQTQIIWHHFEKNA